jgi:hypothetical protein
MKRLVLSHLFLVISTLTFNLQAQQEFYGVSKPISIEIISENTIPRDFIKKYVENSISTWQLKGEFEKTIDYQIRVNEKTRNEKANELAMEAAQELKIKQAQLINWKELQISEYDADNETFLINSKALGNFALPIPIKDAKEFRDNWDKMKFVNADFYVSDEKLFFSKVDIINPLNQKRYSFDTKHSSTFSASNITYNFAPLEIDFPTDQVLYSGTRIEATTTFLGLDPVSTDIPITNVVNSNTFALIIGNENYTREIKVPFAHNDAKVFSKYCQKTLGIPEINIHVLLDGTYGQILSEIKWVSDVIKAYNGEAHIIFFYAGHGMPDEREKSAYLLPVDGSSSIPQTAVKVDELYDKLSEHPSKSVIVFLDACFTGAARDGILADGRGVRIRPKYNSLKGNILVFSATSEDETAFPYKDKQHGLFTYYLLKRLQETKGEATLYDLSNFVTEKVSRQSIVINNKSQTPKLSVSLQFKEDIKMMKLK